MMYIYGPTLRWVHCDYTGLHFLLSSIIRFQNESFYQFQSGRVGDGTLSPDRVPQHGVSSRAAVLLYNNHHHGERKQECIRSLERNTLYVLTTSHKRNIVIGREISQSENRYIDYSPTKVIIKSMAMTMVNRFRLGMRISENCIQINYKVWDKLRDTIFTNARHSRKSILLRKCQ